MRNRLWLLTVVWYALTTNILLAQSPVSLELQSKAGERITGAIADPIMDSYLNPAMMDFDHFTLFTGGKYDEKGEPDKLHLPLNGTHLYMFMPYKSWNLGVMLDGQLLDNYTGFNNNLFYQKEFNHKFYNATFTISRYLSPKIKAGLSYQMQKSENYNFDKYINYYTMTSIYNRYKTAGKSISHIARVGFEYKFHPNFSIVPGIKIENYQRKESTGQESRVAYFKDFSSSSDQLSVTLNDFYVFKPLNCTIPEYNLLLNYETSLIRFRLQGDYEKYNFKERFEYTYSEYNPDWYFDPENPENKTNTYTVKPNTEKDISTFTISTGAEIPIQNVLTLCWAYQYKNGKTQNLKRSSDHYLYEYGDKEQNLSFAFLLALTPKLKLNFTYTKSKIENDPQVSYPNTDYEINDYKLEQDNTTFGFSYKINNMFNCNFLAGKVSNGLSFAGLQLQYSH